MDDFSPQLFPQLKGNTDNLGKRLSTQLGRYSVLDDVLPSVALEDLLKRMDIIAKCGTKRTDVLAVFTQLTTDLREVLRKKDQKECEQATLYLLGALIHRYFRIIDERAVKNNLVFWGAVKVTSATDSDLFNAIRMVLNLKAPKAQFKEMDLLTLDVKTIVDALEVFQHFMLKVGKDKYPGYMSYPYLRDNPNFTTQLADIIKVHQTRGATILNGKDVFAQFKAVDFVQSLAGALDAEHVQIETALKNWCKSLKQAHPDFAAMLKPPVEPELKAPYLQHLSTHFKDNPSMLEKISVLLHSCKIMEKLADMSHDTLQGNLITCHTERITYILFGGYTLLLKNPAVEVKLLNTMYESLAFDDTKHVMKNDVLMHGINFLENYVLKYPEVALKVDFFGGKAQLKTALVNCRAVLKSEMKEESAPVAAM